MKTIMDALDYYGVPARKVLEGTWSPPSPLKTLINTTEGKKEKKEVKEPISLNNYRSKKSKNKIKMAKKNRRKNRKN